MKRSRPVFLVLLALILAMSACGGSSSSAEPAAPPSAEPTAIPTEAPTEAPAPVPSEAAADGADALMTMWEEVEEEFMTPIGPESLVDGVYPVAMKSSSAMFKADHCQLTVADGKMEVTLYMTSGLYSRMFCGAADEVNEGDTIPLEEGADFGAFTLPLEVLDKGVSFAAYSEKYGKWYDRTLLFRSDSLPVEAFAEGFLTTAEALGLDDGEYTAEVILRGGTGKAHVSSPARLTVENGACTAEIVWSSSNYDYMRIGEEKYLPVNRSGNSIFLLPVSCFDRSFSVIADITAMSQPHEITYTLYFDSGTIQPVG